jgi:hypothetical protein
MGAGTIGSSSQEATNDGIFIGGMVVGVDFTDALSNASYVAGSETLRARGRQCLSLFALLD